MRSDLILVFDKGNHIKKRVDESTITVWNSRTELYLQVCRINLCDLYPTSFHFPLFEFMCIFYFIPIYLWHKFRNRPFCTQRMYLLVDLEKDVLH